MEVNHLDLVPGTVHLVDVAHNMRGEAHLGGQSDIVLVPKLSADSEGPLNWTKGRKLLAVVMCYVNVFSIGIPTPAQYSVITNISDDSGISVADLNTSTGLMFLFLGWACLFWQPIALVYGRHGVYLISSLLTIPIMVWTAYSTSSGVWYASLIIVGILASPFESLPEVTIPDLYFAHNQGLYMGIYAFMLFGSNFFAPFAAGFINDAAG
ncbi:MAG: hypothetical protein M1827_005242 [Pycnora praestabilis]|nr:MAG: hypothetical protein M1827_005242 [Pycnora praestabilis]